MTWTKERRARQAELIRTWKPWTRSTGPRTAAGKAALILRNQTLLPWVRSTGPRTAEGKARSSRNAFKGANRPWWRAVDTILKRNLEATKEQLTQRERTALATYERLHPDRLREIWIYAADPSFGARTAQEFRALYPTAKITVLAARVPLRANQPRAQS
jgi:hypothetical protein